ncbi:unnamed protein product [Symbiodinium microadriaticum]|nr:unnamed protein product [Symbiodinium microadriaticum]
MEARFPARAFVQTFDEIPEDYKELVVELRSRGVPVELRRTESMLAEPLPLTKDDLVVGDFDWTRTALKQLGIPMPQPPDYPTCLQHILRRRIWQSTLGEIRDQLALSTPDADTQVFIKPAIDTKAFSAIVEPRDQMLATLLEGIPDCISPLPVDLPVHCAEVVDMISEYRVYVVHGEIRAICHYKGPSEGAGALDLTVVEEAVQTLCQSEEGQNLVGFGMDFAVLEAGTCLVEVNDGFSLGKYPGISGKDYADLLVARWHSLMTSSP